MSASSRYHTDAIETEIKNKSANNKNTTARNPMPISNANANAPPWPAARATAATKAEIVTRASRKRNETLGNNRLTRTGSTDGVFTAFVDKKRGERQGSSRMISSMRRDLSDYKHSRPATRISAVVSRHDSRLSRIHASFTKGACLTTGASGLEARPWNASQGIAGTTLNAPPNGGGVAEEPATPPVWSYRATPCKAGQTVIS